MQPFSLSVIGSVHLRAHTVTFIVEEAKSARHTTAENKKKSKKQNKKKNIGILRKGKLWVRNDESLSAWSVWKSLNACLERLFMSTLCAEGKKMHAVS